MKILYGEGFSPEERIEAKIQININIFESMLSLIHAVDFLKLANQLVDHNSFDSFLALAEHSTPDFICPEVAELIDNLWHDPAVQQAWDLRSEYQIIESAGNFFDRVLELTSDDYVPSEADILLARVKTTGIKEEKYVINDAPFEIYDVGGQRNERRKWIHCFDVF